MKRKEKLRVYSVKEVAEMLKTTPIYIYRMIKEGKLDALRLGGKRNIRITEEQLKEFLFNQRRKKNRK